jgi:hypothetical protein
MFVESLSIEQGLISDAERDQWPFDIPCVRALARNRLQLCKPVTFLVGENGSGKSTLVEAIAEAFGLDARGGRAGRKYGNQREKTELGQVMRLGLTHAGGRMRTGPRTKRKGYFLRAETTFGFAEAVNSLPGYWTDEPEAALSFSSGRSWTSWTTGAATSATRTPTCATSSADLRLAAWAVPSRSPRRSRPDPGSWRSACPRHGPPGRSAARPPCP